MRDLHGEPAALAEELGESTVASADLARLGEAVRLAEAKR
jgi:hypothetical protein